LCKTRYMKVLGTCQYPNFELSQKFALETFSCWNGLIARYHTRDQRHHDVWLIIMMKIIQMKKLTVSPQRRRQDECNRFTVVVKWCKWNPVTKDMDEGIIFVPVADMLDRNFKNALHIFRWILKYSVGCLV
jgi:hypothetical protein